MSAQLILRIAGIAALVVAALFAILAVHYYLTQDIRSVMDDLSGKARARGVAGARRRSSERGTTSAARQARGPAPTATVHQGAVEQAPRAADDAFAASAFDDEDEAGTVLVAATSAVAPPATDPAEEDLVTMVATEESDMPEAGSISWDMAKATSADAPSSALFQITRRLVLIHSQEIIAEREGYLS